MRGTLKARLLAGMNALGVSRVAGGSAWRRRQLLILCYHGISLADEHEWNAALYMPRQRFEARLAALARAGCAVLPLGEAVDRLYRNDLPDRAVALTFDDGYFNFLKQADPLLADRGYPATVYLPTLRCEHNMPILNLVVAYMMWRQRDRELFAPEVPGLGTERYRLATPRARRHVLARINAAIEPADPEPEERDAIARTIAGRLGLDFDQYAEQRLFTLMTPAEVTRLARRGVDFQLHTHRHRTPEDGRLFVQEIEENRRRVEAMTGRPAVHFCYPSGVYRKSYLPLLREHGVVSATTTETGIASPSSHPLLLPRFVDTSTVSPAEFEAWLHGVMPWLRGAAMRDNGRHTWFSTVSAGRSAASVSR